MGRWESDPTTAPRSSHLRPPICLRPHLAPPVSDSWSARHSAPRRCSALLSSHGAAGRGGAANPALRNWCTALGRMRAPNQLRPEQGNERRPVCLPVPRQQTRTPTSESKWTWCSLPTRAQRRWPRSFTARRRRARSLIVSRGIDRCARCAKNIHCTYFNI